MTMNSSTRSALTYQNIIQHFFVDDRTLVARPGRISKACGFVVENVPNRDLSEKLLDVITVKVTSVELTFSKKWREFKWKSKTDFESHNEKWLQTELKLPSSILSKSNKLSTQMKKSFKDLSERQKNRRVDELADCDVGQLLLGAARAAKRDNNIDLEFILRSLSKDNQIATNLARILKAENRTTKPA